MEDVTAFEFPFYSKDQIKFRKWTALILFKKMMLKQKTTQGTFFWSRCLTLYFPYRFITKIGVVKLLLG